MVECIAGNSPAKKTLPFQTKTMPDAPRACRTERAETVKTQAVIDPPPVITTTATEKPKGALQKVMEFIFGSRSELQSHPQYYRLDSRFQLSPDGTKINPADLT